MRCGDVFRYKCTAAISSTTITWRCLQRLIFVNYGTSTGRTCVQSFKISKIKMWAPPLFGTSYNTPTTLGIRVRTGDGALAQEKFVSDVSTNLRGAFVRVKFSEIASDIGKWHAGTYAFDAASVAFVLEAPQGTIIDLSFSYQLASSAAGGIALTSSSSMSGAIMVNYLDNTNTSGTAGNAYMTPVNELANVASAF
jgi:hypothetical protein